MNAFWKGFFATLGTVIAAIFAFLLGRKRSSPSSIEKAANAEVEKKREEIKKDSDEALAERFNRLTKNGGKS